MLSGPIVFLQKSYIVSRTKLTASLLEIKENNKIFLLYLCLVIEQPHTKDLRSLDQNS